MVHSVLLGTLMTCGLSPAAAKDGRVRSDGWTLRVHTDRFTGRTRCLLGAANHHLRYQPGAIGFRVGQARDTFSAWYRVDGGAPVHWQDRTAALFAAGVSFDGPTLDNPTDGWVWVPVAEVERAHMVAVAREGGRVRHFAIRDFSGALATACGAGCASDDAFRI